MLAPAALVLFSAFFALGLVACSSDPAPRWQSNGLKEIVTAPTED